jgi:diguanylate cyclase (GGDEF)-like protein/putative nucleotidyltransferase with HDIG domain
VGRPSTIARLHRFLDGYRSERDRAAAALRRATSLERVARDLAAAVEPDAVLRSIPQSALSVVDAEYAALVLRRGSEFEIAAGAGLATRVVGLKRRTDEGVFSDVLAQRATVVHDDYARHPRAVASARDLGIRTIVGVPIFVSNELVACLTAARTTLRPFDADDRAAIEGLAAHASIALRNARHLEQARLLEQLSRSAMDVSDPAELLTQVVEAARAAFSVDVAIIVRVGDNEAEVVAVAAAAHTIRGARGPLGPFLRRAARGELVTVDDFPAMRALEPDAPRAGFFDAIGGRAAILSPIRVYGRVVAVLIVGTTDAHRAFDDLDRRAVVSFAETTRAALRAAETRRESQMHIERLSTINDLAGRLTLIHDPVEISRLAWEAAGKLVPRDAFYVARYDEKSERFEFLFQEDLGVLVSEHTEMPLGDGPSSRAVRTGEPYVISRQDTASAAGRAFGDDSRRSASAVHVPLRIGHRIVGVLSAQSYTPEAYDAEHVAILRSLATVVGSALENAAHVSRTRELYLASVHALAAAVDARDPYTRSHSARVAALARTIAEEMRLPVDEIRRVQLGALLHDIGKIGIPDAILNKPGPLSEEEWVIMRTHSALGGAIVDSVEPLAELSPIIRWHHERFDGTGYPDRLAGDAVPLGSYIVAAADAFEVIVSRRAYKQALSVEHAVAELQRCSGAQFHPAVVEAFTRIIHRDRTEGTPYLSRVKAIEHEDIDDVPGPGDVLGRVAATTTAHARQLAILQRIAGEILSLVDLDVLADRLLRIVCEGMGYENGFLLTLDESGERLVIRAAVGPSAGYVGQEIGRGEGISGWVVEHGRLQNVRDVHADTRFVGPADIRSSLIAPLRIADEPVGVIGIESVRRAAFTADDEALLTAVSHQVAAAVRVARLHRAAQVAASTDALTGLPNRRTFFQRVAAALRESLIGSRPLTVAAVDVDLLKSVNDRLGHASGDEALVRIGQILAEGVRDNDLVARIGGDEYGIVFTDAPILVAERIMRRLAGQVATTALAGDITLPTISWGLATGGTAATVDALLDTADQAMYRHKRHTRPQLLKAE